jgi:hypothetical protein
MREPPAWLALLTSVAWIGHALVTTMAPVYYAPQSVLDYAAVVAYTTGLVLLAACVWTLRTAASRWIWTFAGAAAVGLFAAGVVNLFEDGFGLPLGWLYVASVLFGVVALVALLIALLRERSWGIAILIAATLGGLFLVSTWFGGATLALTWVAQGMLVLRGPVVRKAS